ncbi:MAG: site-specific integrase [Sedimentisphaerales bacterium]|nr:site-specific integrase [Sedimentisphaerales bacterium]
MSCKEDSLNQQEINMLWLVCSSIRDKFMFGCLILAGLRVSELVHLKRSWVNFDESTITVPVRQNCDCWECLHKRDGLWKPKTKHGARTIRIDPQLRPILEEYLAGNDGLGLTRQRVWQRMKDLCRVAAILHNAYPHCLRSTCAIELAHKGISSASLQYLLGWSKLSSAEAYVRSDRTRALEEVDEIYVGHV